MASLLAATLYQEYHEMNHKLWNIGQIHTPYTGTVWMLFSYKGKVHYGMYVMNKIIKLLQVYVTFADLAILFSLHWFTRPQRHLHYSAFQSVDCERMWWRLFLKRVLRTKFCVNIFEIDSEGRLRTKRYDKRDGFSCPIVNFSFICWNIPAAPIKGVYISQLIRYSRACSSYQDFINRGLLPTRKLLNQVFLLVKLKSSLRKSYGRHHDLVYRFGISVS